MRFLRTEVFIKTLQHQCHNMSMKNVDELLTFEYDVDIDLVWLC